MLPLAIGAAVTAEVVSGLPSTLHAVSTGSDPVEASLAAGSVVLRNEARTESLLIAAALTHGALSPGWAAALARMLPRGHERSAGVLAGLAIAAVTLGMVGRRFPRIRALPLAPQVADHIAFGLVVGSVLSKGRRRAQ